MTWSYKVTKRNRLLFRLVRQVRHIDASGYGLLPTLTASDARMGGVIGKNDTYKLTSTGTYRRYSRSGHNSSLSLGRLMKLTSGYNVMPATAEGIMGYPIDWTELKP
jgi:hypothetical protein